MNIHEKIKAEAGLAVMYAEDGAFRSAARVLRNLAAEVDKHADYCDREDSTARSEASA